MRKELINLKVVKGKAARGERKGQDYEYVEATLKSTGKNWLASNTTRQDRLFIMNPDLIAIFKDYICKANGGNADGTQNLELPDDYRFINNVFRVRVPLNAKYVRVYDDDVRDANGKILHRKGDLYKTELGSIMQYDALEVLAIKVEDEDTGEMYWVDSPERIAQRILARNYRLVEQNGIAAAETDITVGDSAGAAEKPAEETKPDDGKMSREELLAKLAELDDAQ